METRQEAKRFLSQYQSIIKKMKVLKIEWDEANTDYGVSAVEMTGMPSGSSGKTSINERITFKRLEINSQLKALKEQQLETLQGILNVINSIDDANEQDLLTLRYLKGMTWEAIAMDLNYSWRHTHRIHKQALNHVIECHNQLML